MSTRMLYSSIGVWFAIVAAVTFLGPLSGASITVGTGGLALVVGLVPAAIMLKLWGAAPTQTVAELLHAVERNS